MRSSFTFKRNYVNSLALLAFFFVVLSKSNLFMVTTHLTTVWLVSELKTRYIRKSPLTFHKCHFRNKLKIHF